jgi:hypothetical protein
MLRINFRVNLLIYVCEQDHLSAIGLHHPLDGVTNLKYKLLRFIQLTIFLQNEEGTSFFTGIGVAI